MYLDFARTEFTRELNPSPTHPSPCARKLMAF